MSVSVGNFYDAAREKLSMELVTDKKGLARSIIEPSINRPGLALAGFFKHFAFRRIQVLGMAENDYLSSMSEEKRKEALRSLFSKHVPCVVVSRRRKVWPEMYDLSEEFNVPVMRTSLITGLFINAATIVMENLVAPRITAQGTMVDIMGIGVLMEGRPGIGKSEAALALITKGHSLVADDVTVLRKADNRIMGSAVPVTRYHLEIRGIGIIHVPSLYGVASVRDEKELDLIVTLHEARNLDVGRLDLNPQTREVLDITVPHLNLPVAAGRDLANIIEAATLNKKLKRLGHDAVKELDAKLVALMTGKGGEEND